MKPSGLYPWGDEDPGSREYRQRVISRDRPSPGFEYPAWMPPQHPKYIQYKDGTCATAIFKTVWDGGSAKEADDELFHKSHRGYTALMEIGEFVIATFSLEQKLIIGTAA